MDYTDMAQHVGPASAYNEFLKIKVQLMRGDAKAASCELPKMQAAEDFTQDLLRASGRPTSHVRTDFI